MRAKAQGEREWNNQRLPKMTRRYLNLNLPEKSSARSFSIQLNRSEQRERRQNNKGAKMRNLTQACDRAAGNSARTAERGVVDGPIQGAVGGLCAGGAGGVGAGPGGRRAVKAEGRRQSAEVGARRGPGHSVGSGERRQYQDKRQFGRDAGLAKAPLKTAHSCACEGAHTAGWKSPSGR